MKYENVTIYVEGMFGFVRYEVRTAIVERKPYAQYPVAYWVTFIPKGKRSPRQFVKRDTNSHFVMLKGHGHPKELSAVFEDVGPSTPGVTCQRTRHSSYAPEWSGEFEIAMEAYLKEKGLALVDWSGDLVTELHAAAMGAH